MALNEKYTIGDVVSRLDKILEILQRAEPTEKRYIRNKELARLLGVSESSLQNMRMSGTLPFIKIQGTILYDLDEIHKTLKLNKQ